MTSEQEWEQVLQIKTAGRDDSRSDTEHHPYEPTDYCVLERLANSGHIRKKYAHRLWQWQGPCYAFLWRTKRVVTPLVLNTMNDSMKGLLSMVKAQRSQPCELCAW